MGTYNREIWLSDGSGQSRKERRSGAYFSFAPTKLSHLPLSLEPDTAGDVARAELALAQLATTVKTLQSSEGIARLLLRAEAVSSSHIEGLTIGTRRLLRAELNQSGESQFKFDPAAAEIVGNIHAMESAVAAAQEADVITVDTILSIHRMLCANTRIESIGGLVRDRQNWVGGNSYNPLGADYVPPSPQQVPDLLEDLAAYCNSTATSPVVQAALVHAQFETIHPFMDGNGRTGRALIHLVLRRRGIVRSFVPPISLVLATQPRSYTEGLSDFRYDDSEDEAHIRARLNDWVSFFAAACERACAEAQQFEEATAMLQAQWRAKLGAVRGGSALEAMLPELAGTPLFTVASMAKITGRAISAVSGAIERCVEAGIVKPTGSQKRNRVFEVPDVISQYNLFERRLASPVGDTSIEPPTRSVPERLGR